MINVQPFWTSGGHHRLECNARGWLVPTDGYWRHWLERPELALVEESCDGERALHAALVQSPRCTVTAQAIDAIEDADARANVRLFLDFRDAVLVAGSLESAYLGFFRSGSIQVPPLFLDLMVQAIVSRLLDGDGDAWNWRAAELLFRRQRVSVQDGRVLCGDSEVLDMLSETGGLGDMGRLLRQGGAALPTVQMEVLGPDNAARYRQSQNGEGRFNFLLDLTHGVQRELPHGLILNMHRAQSGLKALARVLEKWVEHFLGTPVQIQPESRVDDPSWRWHLGLDAESSPLLNDLYLGHPVAPERLQRLISLFRLRFDDPRQMRADLQGHPVYLGLAMAPNGFLKLKPQNE